MTSVLFAGVDLEAEFPGLTIYSLPDLLARPRFALEEVRIPGLAGALLQGPLEVQVREFRVGIQLDGGDVDGNRALLAGVNALLGTAPIPVTTIDRPDRCIYARVVDTPWVAERPQLISEWSKAELVFRAEDPNWRELAAQWYGFGATYVPLPLWDAPTAPVIELLGPATGPFDVILADHRGEVLRTSRYTASLAADTFYRILTESWGMATFKSLAGTYSQDETLLDAAYLFPAQLDPRTMGGPLLGTGPMIRTTAGTGRIYYPRQAY